MSSTYVLYKRVVLDEDPRRHIPRNSQMNDLLAQIEAEVDRELGQQQNQDQEQRRS